MNFYLDEKASNYIYYKVIDKQKYKIFPVEIGSLIRIKEHYNLYKGKIVLLIEVNYLKTQNIVGEIKFIIELKFLYKEKIDILSIYSDNLKNIFDYFEVVNNNNLTQNTIFI